MGFVADASVKRGFVPDTPTASATTPPDSGFLHTLQGEGEVGGAAVGNLIPNAINSALDILHRASGGVLKRPQVPTIPVGQAGQDLVHDVGDMIPKGNPNNVENQIDAIRSKAMGKPNDTVADVANQAGEVGKDVMNVLPAAGLVKGATAIGAGAAETAPATIDDALNAIGYKNLPRQGGGSGTAKLGAKVVGEQSLAGQQTLTNQAVTDTLAKHEAGVPQNSELSYDTTAAARAAGPGRVYDAARDALPMHLTQDPELHGAISSVGDTASQLPRSPDVDGLKQTMLNQPGMTRDELFANIAQARERASRFYASDQPDAHAIGDAYQGVANAYEGFVGRQLAANPNAGVSLEDWQNARTAFAKNYAVQSAIKGTSADASKLATLQRKDPGNLTGGLRLIAEQQNRYPLSTGFGPATFEQGGVGASGTPQGILARHVTGPLLGAGIGTMIGGPAGGAIGGATGLMGSELFQSVIRRALSGSPEAAGDIAREAVNNPQLASFFDREIAPQHLDLTPPPGRAFDPHQPALATGSPQRDFFGTGANHVPEAGPMGIDAPAAPHQGEIPLMDVLSHGVEQPPAPGLTAGPMGAPAQGGIPFQRNAAHEAGDLSLQNEPPSLMDQLSRSSRPPNALQDMSLSKEERARERERVADLRARDEGIEPEFEPEPVPRRTAEHEGEVARRMAQPDEPPSLMDLLGGADYPKVLSQGVPEDILQRSSGRPKFNKRDQVGQTAIRKKSSLMDLLEGGGG